MILVIFYRWLILCSVCTLSATSANEISTTDKRASNTGNTRLLIVKSTGSSDNTDRNKDCVLPMEENEIANIVERIENDEVNILDLHFFDGTRQNDKLFEDMRIILVTPVGREILLILYNKYYRYIPWTLEKRREFQSLNVHFGKNISFTKCTKEHVAASILGPIVVRNKNARRHEICYEETTYTNEFNEWRGYPYYFNRSTSHQMCCRISKTDSDRFKYECSKEDSFLQHFSLSIILTILIICTLTLHVLGLLYMLLHHSFFQKLHPDYYRLQESTMSLTSILVKMAWEENGYIILSIFRRFVILCALGGNLYFCVNFLLTTASVYLWIYTILVCLPLSSIFFIYIQYNYTSPKFSTFKESEIKSNVHHCSSLPNRVFIFPPFLWLSFIPLTLVDVLRLGFVSNIRKYRNIFLAFDTLVATVFIGFQFQTCYILAFALQSLLLGLLLNLTYYLPYLAAISVFTFYSYGTWKGVEEKYFLLKLIIHEECKQKKPEETKKKPREDEILQSVLPKKIYDSIREKLLPYDKNLRWVILKLLWLLVISYVIQNVVRMLHTFNSPAAVQVVITASVSILPHILNTIFWNAGEEDRKEAWKKEMKINVKGLVETIPENEIVLSLAMITKFPADDIKIEN